MVVAASKNIKYALCGRPPVSTLVGKGRRMPRQHAEDGLSFKLEAAWGSSDVITTKRLATGVNTAQSSRFYPLTCNVANSNAARSGCSTTGRLAARPNTAQSLGFYPSLYDLATSNAVGNGCSISGRLAAGGGVTHH